SEPFLLSCPAPESISVVQIPYSLHSVYVAESQGIGFSSLDLSMIEPAATSFFFAEVSEVNDYWSFACAYQLDGLHLVLSTNLSPAYQLCHFVGEAQQCSGTAEECVLSCPERPE